MTVRPLIALQCDEERLVVQGTVDSVSDCLADAFRFRCLDALLMLDGSGVPVLVDPCRPWKLSAA